MPALRRDVRRLRAAGPVPPRRVAAAGALRPRCASATDPRSDRRPRRRTCGATTSCCPCPRPEHVVTLGEGMTPLLPAPRLGAELGLPRLLVKDDGPAADRVLQGARRRGRRLPGQGARARPGSRCRRTATRARPGRRTPPAPACGCLIAMPVDAPDHHPGRERRDRRRPPAGRRPDLRRRAAGRAGGRRPAPTTGSRWRRSRSPTASRARRRWASRSPSSSAGGCPT